VTVYNDTISENLSITQADLVGLGTTVSEGLKLTQLMDVIRAQNGVIAETITLADAITVFYGIELVERIIIAQGQVANSKFNQTVAELMELHAALISTLPAEVTEAVQIAVDQVVQRAVTVIEALELTEAVAPSLVYRMSIGESLVVADALLRFLGASVVEGLTVTDTIVGEAFKSAQVAEALTIADALTPQLILRIDCDETLELTADEAVRMVLSAQINEAFELSGAYLAPDGSVTTWAMNTRTAGVTEYQNYAFNSFARIGNKYIGATDDGLYELLGDDDDGDDIIATIRSGFAQWSGTHLGSFKAAYLAVAGAGAYVLRVLTRDGKTYNYRVTAQSGRTVKVNMGKGLRSRYFAFELVTAGQDFDLDTLEFVPLVAQRRV
jgi:hypothetical protein